MVKTASNMVELGSAAPDFTLTDVITGQPFTLSKNKGKSATVIMFICNHCPYVRHINQALTQTAHDYLSKEIQFIAINSNDAEHYPDDSPENMIKTAKTHNYPFPYLYDETQEVAIAFHAACTPDFFVYDSGLHLVYRGQFDDARPGKDIKPTGGSIRKVLDCILNYQPIPEEQKPSLGCNIKWKV